MAAPEFTFSPPAKATPVDTVTRPVPPLPSVVAPVTLNELSVASPLVESVLKLVSPVTPRVVPTVAALVTPRELSVAAPLVEREFSVVAPEALSVPVTSSL